MDARSARELISCAAASLFSFPLLHSANSACELMSAAQQPTVYLCDYLSAPLWLMPKAAQSAYLRTTRTVRAARPVFTRNR